MDRNISTLKDLISHMIINIFNYIYIYIYIYTVYIYIFTFSHLADAFINEDNGINQNQ